MSIYTDRSIGTGAPGLGGPLPSPGASCTLHVKVRRDWPEGDFEVDEHTHVWEGYTAAEAYQNRLTRLREARANIVATDGHVIVVRRQRDGWVDVETLTFEEVQVSWLCQVCREAADQGEVVCRTCGQSPELHPCSARISGTVKTPATARTVPGRGPLDWSGRVR